MSGKMRWTPEQINAIEARDSNLLVAAAAGAGKTAVLVERIIKRLTDPINPVDIDRLLVVTFTNAAATEMKERIGDALSSALEKDPESRVLQRQLALLNRASITTIHSFCLEVIKNNFHMLDIDPGFRIANETEGVLLKLEALEELFEDRYLREEMDEVFLDLVESYSGNRDDKRLQDMVLGLYDFVQSHPWPKKWLHVHSEDFAIPEGTDLGDTVWGREILDGLKIEIEGLVGSVNGAIRIIEGDEGLFPYLDNYNEEYIALCQILKACDAGWMALYKSIGDMDFKRLPRCGKDADVAKKEQVKKIRDNAKDTIKGIQEGLFSSKPKDMIRDLNALYPMMKCLTELVLELDERYRDKKRAKGLLDFNDLEHMCLQVLLDEDEDGEKHPSKVAHGYQDKFEEVMVDEYQDSNLIQEVILRTVSRADTKNPNMFMVGDVKQSIYRFRQARPELFMEKYGSYPLESGFSDRKILLYKNFRSREEVVNGINYIFGQIMSVNVGELNYDEEEALRSGAIYKEDEKGGLKEGLPVEIDIIDLGDGGSDNSDYFGVHGETSEGSEGSNYEDGDTIPSEEPIGSIETEARLIAERIKELTAMDGKGSPARIYDKSMDGYRDAEFKDIVILLRTTANWADTFAEELSIQGIPAYTDSGTGYFKTIEVQTMLSLLQIIDNPRQDIPLLAVLRSPMVGFSPDELIDIRLMDRESIFYETLIKMANEGEGKLSDKAQGFLDKLEDWRDKALYMSTDELIWYLYGETGYYSCVGAMPGGLQRQANLRILFERARQYEETSYRGLFNFIHFIDKLKVSQGDMGSAKILGENENVVRIMSIHKSKGLEFPIVFVSGCGKKFNLTDATRSILFHQDLGLGPDFVDYDTRLTYSTLAKEALKSRITIETLSEEMRILYVAMTRARERLILTGSTKNLKRDVKTWFEALIPGDEKLSKYRMMKARRYLDWVGPALLRHKDGASLRELLDMPEGSPRDFLEDKSRWQVNILSKLDILAPEDIEDERVIPSDFLWEIGEEDEISLKDGVVHRLEWEYPHIEASRLPVKVSVTELKRHLDSEFADEAAVPSITMPTLIKRPSFLEEEAKKLTAAERGSLLHFVLQHLDFKRISTEYDIRAQIDDMVRAELITQEQAKVVDVLRIDRFLRSSLGIRMLKAEPIYRETPFTIELPGSKLYPELSETLCQKDGIILQGIIDCFFEEPEGIVLIDYKTDYVAYGDGLDIIRNRYKTQIDYYTYALEKIRGKEVIERFIYLFWNGQILKF